MQPWISNAHTVEGHNSFFLLLLLLFIETAEVVESQNLNPRDSIQDQVPAQANMRVNHLHTRSKEGTSQRLKSEQTSENEIPKPLNYPIFSVEDHNLSWPVIEVVAQIAYFNRNSWIRKEFGHYEL